MIDWNIQTRARACQACEKTFEDKQPYHTVLLDEGTAYVRRDVCEGCWLAAPEGPWSSRPGFISHWQGVFAVPAPQTELIHRETAEGLLRKLVGRQDPRTLAAMFILAVMLERKRILKVKEQIQRDGRRTFIYEQPRTGDLFTILDPELGLDQLEEVQHDVARLLEHGLDDPAGESESPSAAPPELAAVVADVPSSDSTSTDEPTGPKRD